MISRDTARKGLSLTMIGGIVLALIGVGVLIMMFSDTYGSGFQGTFCGIYASLSILIPGDSPPPEGCGEGSKVSYDKKHCPEQDPCLLSFAGEIANCWQDYNGYWTEDELCQGWNVMELQGGDITRSEVVSTMQANDICPNQMPCSAVEFDGPVSEGDFVVIEYQSDEDAGWERIMVR